MDLWSPIPEAEEILSRFSANREPTMVVLIAMKVRKLGRAETDLPTMEPNRLVQVQRMRQTSG